MHIREGKITDSNVIAKLLTDLGYPGTETFIKDKIAQQIEHPDAKLLVAVEGPEILGFISLHFIPQIALRGDFCRISYFCVAEKARNQGIGTSMERHAESLARARGCDRIEVHSHARRTSAHKFYFRQGYLESPKYLIKTLK